MKTFKSVRVVEGFRSKTINDVDLNKDPNYIDPDGWTKWKFQNKDHDELIRGPAKVLLVVNTSEHFWAEIKRKEDGSGGYYAEYKHNLGDGWRDWGEFQSFDRAYGMIRRHCEDVGLVLPQVTDFLIKKLG